MTKDNLMDALNGIDFDMVEDAQREMPKKRSRKWIPWAAAASLAAVLALCFGMWDRYEQTAPINPPNNDPPVISYFTGGQALTGKQEIIFGDKEDTSEALDILTPDFYAGVVLEVQVLEVLPDTYRDLNEYHYLNNYQICHVARLKVLDQVNVDGFPDEIWFQYAYYDTDILNGHDSFLVSLDQIGVENYMLVNQSQNRVDYFTNMFEISVGDLGYGSMIAFQDGRVDESFWDKAADQCPNRIIKAPGSDWFLNPKFEYVASAGSTVRQVKESILAEHWVGSFHEDYITLEDVFTHEESNALKAYLSPESGNVFLQDLADAQSPFIRFTRVVNGFLTDERIIVKQDGVERQGATYSAEDLARMPDIGQTLEQMNLKELEPSHIEVSEDMVLQYAAVSGAYRKVDGQIYGIVTVIWRYRFTGSEGYDRFDDHIMDDCYYLYDAQCIGRIVEREELQAIIGDDTLIRKFSYDRQVAIY